MKNVKQESDGRYTVSPLFKQNFIPIKNNYYHARKRYKTLKQMIGGDQLKNKTYSEAIQQMIENEEVEEVIESPVDSKLWIGTFIICPIMEYLSSTVSLLNVALFSMQVPKTQKAFH